MSNYFIGVDPGSNGGLAALDQEGKVFALTRMPDSSSEVLKWFKLFEDLSGYAMLEQISGYIGEEHPGSRMFEFGRGYGGLEMALVASGFIYFDDINPSNILDTMWQHITPQKWQRGLSLRTKTKGETDTSWKNYLKDQASALFPRVKVTKATADALLIAHYCRLTKGR